MKQNNNSAGQLITLLFSINLHYCCTQEVPPCQRRDSIKRLPEQTYLPCIPKSDTFGSQNSRAAVRWNPPPWNVSPPFLEFAWGIDSWSVFHCPDESQLTYSLSRQRSCNVIIGWSFSLQVLPQLSFCPIFTNNIEKSCLLFSVGAF